VTCTPTSTTTPYRLDELLEWADRDERDNQAAPADAE
jgi:hypothetical protein